MRVSKFQRFAASVKCYKHFWWTPHKRCCRCDDDVYKEDMWYREETTRGGSFPSERLIYVCNTCMPTDAEAVMYFAKRVNLLEREGSLGRSGPLDGEEK